jgi:nucleoside-triphosphatase THEP1
VVVTVLVTVWGSSPGIGKSTLCAGLSEWLSGAGLRVDLFREEEILTRPQYAEVATARFADSVLPPAPTW